MDFEFQTAPVVLHWNYRGFTEFPLKQLTGEETEVTDIYLKENLISKLPADICKFKNLESLYLSGNDITELPKEISELQQLKCLDVSGNRLSDLPTEISALSCLKFLILDENVLSELPLRLSELTSLQYLSVTDNNLKWLPQKPVFNYHHCELRFWRNPDLKMIPYSLWYHMFRDQQTRSLNIGCLAVPKSTQTFQNGRCRLQLKQDSNECYYDVNFPRLHGNILQINNTPTLYEICKRKFYQMLVDASKRCTVISRDFIHNANKESYINNNVQNKRFCDENGNNCHPNKMLPNRTGNYDFLSNIKRVRYKKFIPADVLERYYAYLPTFMKSELSDGPTSKCENLNCRAPVFDFAFYEFCLGRIILIENFEQIILSAAFCSKRCADEWKRSKSDILTWSLL